MQYDAFISYKSEDRAWAEALYTRLTQRNRKIFYDYQSLRVGPQWEPQLTKALAESGALIVLWSKKAASQETMTWTEEERYLFKMNEIRSPRERTRPVIFVLLDATPTTLGAYQHVLDIRDGNHYAQAPDAAPAAVWTSVVDKVLDGIDEGAGVRRVKTLVLSARRDDFNAGDIGKQRWKALTELLEAQNVIAKGAPPEAELDRRYGPTPRDWRPFATDTITNLLEALRLRLETDADALRMRFENVDADFESNDRAAVAAAAQRLSRELALIVVDPLSLYQETIGRRVGSLAPCFRSAMNALVVPALKIADDTQLNELLRGTAAANLAREFFRPAIPLSSNLPSVGLNVRNTEELGRILLLAIGRNSSAEGVPAVNSILAP